MSEEQGFMEKLRHLQDNCLKMLIQPERIQYMEHDLGCQTQYVEDQMYLRKDFCVQNRQNFSMACTYYERSPSRQTTGGCRDSFSFTDNQQRPSILTYCHSQTGNRMEGLPLLTFCAKLRINLLLFDFAGCGHSGGLQPEGHVLVGPQHGGCCGNSVCRFASCGVPGASS